MADTNTANLGLLIADLNDTFNFGAHVENNFTTIDALMGAVQCTSTTRPSNTYAGQIIYETDSKRYAQNTGTKATPAWTYMSHAAMPATNSALPSVGVTQGELAYLTDLATVAAYNGSAWRLPGIFVATSTTLPTGGAVSAGALAYATDTGSLMVAVSSTTWRHRSPIVCTSTTRPTANLGSGCQIFETDTGRSLIYNGSNWVPMGQMVMAAPLSTSTNGTAGSTTTGTEVFDAVMGYHQVSLISGRRYQASVNGLIGNAGVAADSYTVQIRDSQSSSNPTSASTLIAQSQWTATAAGSAGRCSIALEQSFLCTVTGTHTFGVSYTKVSGTGPFTPIGIRELFIEDLGAAY